MLAWILAVVIAVPVLVIGAAVIASIVGRIQGGVVRSRAEVAQVLEAFADGDPGDWEWDDFISVPIKDADLEAIRERMAQLDSEFPPVESGHFCSAEGVAIIRDYARRLREAESRRTLEH